jgi:hypothetical protein
VQPEILLTLSAGSVRPLLAARDPRCPDILAVPQFVATDLQLRGLNLPTDLLAGFGLLDLDRLRDSADRAHCPVLLLSEEPPIDFAERGPAWVKSLDRIKRVAVAANRLGCPAIAVRARGEDTEERFEATAAGVKAAVKEIERYDLNLLLAPSPGITFAAQRLTELIKKIGGFRIGSYPSFGHAFESGDLENTLRKLAPYAPAIAASVRGFAKDGTHLDYSLEACVESVRSVGYGNTLALDLVAASAPAPAAGSRKTARKVTAESIVADVDRARRMLELAAVEAEMALEDEEE